MANYACPKCGAGLTVTTGTRIVTCGHCGTATYIDRSSVLFFHIVPFKIDETEARSVFKRWTAGPDMDKELESGISVGKFEKLYFPMFQFRRIIGGEEKVFVKPAKGTLLPGMQNLEIPPGGLVVFDGSVTPDAEVVEPDVNIESYLPELPGEPTDQSVVYVPIYSVEYSFKGQDYGAVIDGSGGEIHANAVPGRSSASYLGVMTVAALFGVAGGFLAVSWNPIAVLLVIPGFVAGKILGNKVVAEKTGASE